MMPDDDVVIVDPAGNEHRFPAGFDPKKAAAIVRQQGEGAWGTMGHRAAGIKQGVSDTFNLPAMRDAGTLTKDITQQKLKEGYKGPLGTIADNFNTAKEAIGGGLETAGGMAKGLGSALWKLAKPVAPWDSAGAQEKLGAFNALNPGGAEPDQNPTEKWWRGLTNVSLMALMGKGPGSPLQKGAKAEALAAKVGKAWDEAHAIQAFDAIKPESFPGAGGKAAAQRTAAGLGAPGPKLVRPAGAVTADEHLAQLAAKLGDEAAAARTITPTPGKELPPPPFSLGARAAPEQPRWQLLPKEMLTEEETAAAAQAAGGPAQGPARATVEAPTKVAGSKPAYAGAERRGLNRIQTEMEDKAYAQVRAAQARKAALGRATAMLEPKANPTLATTASKVEALGEAVPTPGSTRVDLPVASATEAASAAAGTPLQEKLAAWVSKWKSLTGKAREAFGSNVPSDIRQAMEDQLNQQGNAAPGIRKALGMGPLKRPGLVTPEGVIPPVAEGAAAPVAIPAPPAGSGFVKKPTLTLQQMAETYGLEGAAQRAGMDVTELRARIAAGKDPDKLAALMRSEVGADAAGRALGVSAEDVRASAGKGPSRLPKQAVDRLKAAADKEIAETGQMSQRTAEGLARAQREENELGGFTAFGGVPNIMPFVREHPILAGGAAGGALGYSMANEGDNSDVTLAKALTGAGLGAGLMGGLTNAKKVGESALALRREGFLSGGAIAKNIGTAAGAPLHLATDVSGKAGMSAAREMFNLPKNVQEFWASLKEGTHHPDYAGKNFGRYAPSNIIGAIDATATKALKRAGIGQEDIERVLLTKQRDMLGPTSPNARTASRLILPFQRVPWNVFKESIEEMGHMYGDFQKAGEAISGVAKGNMSLREAKALMPSLRTGADVGALAGGYGLGEWAGNDPKKKYLLSVLLSAFGPRQAFGIMGAVAGMGKQGLAAGAVGGISPIPEQAFDVRALIGAKPAALSAYEKLTGNKIVYK